MTRYVALLRGVNLGAHRAVAMADLRALLTGLGHTAVRTHLRSGNAVFTGPPTDAGPDTERAPGAGAEPEAQRIARELEEGLAAELGLRSDVVVRTAGELRAAMEANPWEVTQPARFLVGFLGQPVDPERLADLDLPGYAPERLAIGERELYLDLADGIRNAKLPTVVSRRLPPMTTRNWNTVIRLLDLAEG